MKSVTNVISGLSYRVAVVEERIRDTLTVQIEHTDNHEVPNVMIYTPTEPTSTIHLPQAEGLRDLYNQIAGNMIVLQALQTVNGEGAPTTPPKGQTPNARPQNSMSHAKKRRTSKK